MQQNAAKVYLICEVWEKHISLGYKGLDLGCLYFCWCRFFFCPCRCRYWCASWIWACVKDLKIYALNKGNVNGFLEFTSTAVFNNNKVLTYFLILIFFQIHNNDNVSSSHVQHPQNHLICIQCKMHSRTVYISKCFLAQNQYLQLALLQWKTGQGNQS